jgi:hypothetical protein
MNLNLLPVLVVWFVAEAWYFGYQEPTRRLEPDPGNTAPW